MEYLNSPKWTIYPNLYSYNQYGSMLIIINMILVHMLSSMSKYIYIYIYIYICVCVCGCGWGCVCGGSWVCVWGGGCGCVCIVICICLFVWFIGRTFVHSTGCLHICGFVPSKKPYRYALLTLEHIKFYFTITSFINDAFGFMHVIYKSVFSMLIICNKISMLY